MRQSEAKSHQSEVKFRPSSHPVEDGCLAWSAWLRVVYQNLPSHSLSGTLIMGREVEQEKGPDERVFDYLLAYPTKEPLRDNSLFPKRVGYGDSSDVTLPFLPECGCLTL